jgi:hypothetical protein
MIMPAGAVDDASMRIIASHVTGSVTHINNLWGNVIDLNISHIVMRAGGWNRVNLVGNFGTNLPGAGGSIGFIPNPLFAGIVFLPQFKNRLFRVDGTLESFICVLNRFEFRLPVILNFK